jgi:hypothetical protein
VSHRNRLALAACIALAVVAAVWWLRGPEWAGATTLAGLSALEARRRSGARLIRRTVKDANLRDRTERRDTERRQEAADAAAKAAAAPVGSSARSEALRRAAADIERGEL